MLKCEDGVKDANLIYGMLKAIWQSKKYNNLECTTSIDFIYFKALVDILPAGLKSGVSVENALDRNFSVLKTLILDKIKHKALSNKENKNDTEAKQSTFHR